ncbi:MAG: beta-propeller fold lactonase family protein, partial [Candidatus Hydrogenedentota bacterium]
MGLETVLRDTIAADLPVADLPDPGAFVNYETPHVHPLDISPDGNTLAVVNTPDGYVELFSIDGSGSLTHSNSIKVGIDPVTARWRNNSELWVVNHISDSISIVDVAAGLVERTLITYSVQLVGATTPNGDEPADVVFYEDDSIAFVSCSRTDFIQIWDLSTYTQFPGENAIYMEGEDPRVMDIYQDKLYAAIFESGNGTTLLFGESAGNGASTAMPPNTAVLNFGQRTDHPYYWDSANDSGYATPDDPATTEQDESARVYQVYAVYPPPNDGTLSPGAAGLDYATGLGTWQTPHGTVDINETDVADRDRFEDENTTSLWTNQNTQRYYFPPPTSMIVRRDYAVAAFDAGAWLDDNGGDWTKWVSGIDVDKDGVYDVGDGDVDYTDESGRVFGWDLLDNDIAILDLAATDYEYINANQSYATEQMNMCMALAVKKNGANAGYVYMVGIEATNEVRFEPNLTGTFVRVMLSVTQADGTPVRLLDLNEAHLDAAEGGAGLGYQDGNVAQPERDKSIGDPRGVAFSPSGATVYISGLGSNNVLALSTTEVENDTPDPRYSAGHTIEVGVGPTGIKHHGTLNRLYVVNKFDASVSVIDTSTAGSETVVQTLAFHDSTPDFINTGRVHFYSTHENSGLGQLACASCHIDGRMDRLAWDLGNPAALVDAMDDLLSPVDLNFTDIRGFGDGLDVGAGAEQTLVAPGSVIMNTLMFAGGSGTNSEAGFEKFHPMKGPMTTQTLQDIIGKEPHHWRGDKRGIEQFAGAFDGLQGDDVPLNSTSMQEFEDFLSAINFPPNPFRPHDNTLPGGPNADGGTNPNLDMTGFFTAPPGTGHMDEVLSASGTPMETVVPLGGDAWNGFKMYVDFQADSTLRCVDCHTLPIGAGPIEFKDQFDLPPFIDDNFQNIPPGTEGEAHQMVVALDGTGQPHIKVPQTRNQYDKEGFFLNQLEGGSGDPMPSRAGFGVLHDGAIDGVVRFLSEPAFSNINRTNDTQPQPTLSASTNSATTDDEMVADIVTFTLALGGADFDYLTTLPGAPTLRIPPAAVDLSAHSGVGFSITVDSTPAGSSYEEDVIYAMTRRANDGHLGLVVFGVKSAERRCWIHSSSEDGTTIFQSDRLG